MKTLKERLGVAGVVAGENYRFGYRAVSARFGLVWGKVRITSENSIAFRRK